MDIFEHLFGGAFSMQALRWGFFGGLILILSKKPHIYQGATAVITGTILSVGVVPAIMHLTKWNEVFVPVVAGGIAFVGIEGIVAAWDRWKVDDILATYLKKKYTNGNDADKTGS